MPASFWYVARDDGFACTFLHSWGCVGSIPVIGEGWISNVMCVSHQPWLAHQPSTINLNQTATATLSFQHFEEVVFQLLVMTEKILPVTSKILLRSSQPLWLTQNVVGVFWCVSNCCWLLKFKISDVRRRLHTVHWLDSNKKKRFNPHFCSRMH